MIVVADSGPLIALAKIRQLSLLSDLYQPVLTGPTVYTETVTAGLAMNADDAAILEQAFQTGQLVVKTPGRETLPHPGRLHRGEAECICLAIELKARWLLVDDFDARQIAQENFTAAGVPTALKGTLGIIVTAAQKDVIPPAEAIEAVQALKDRADIWLAPALCKRVIELLRDFSSSK